MAQVQVQGLEFKPQPRQETHHLESLIHSSFTHSVSSCKLCERLYVGHSRSSREEAYDLLSEETLKSGPLLGKTRHMKLHGTFLTRRGKVQNRSKAEGRK
jgi:hypothetical protein